jgi:hypothetical protein
MYHYRRRGETEEQLQRRYEEYRAICAVCTYQTPDEAERLATEAPPRSGSEALRMVESRLSDCTLRLPERGRSRRTETVKKRVRSSSADYVIDGPSREKIRRMLEESLKSDALRRARETLEREKRLREPEDFALFLEATADLSPPSRPAEADEWKEPQQWQNTDDWIEDLLSQQQRDNEVEPDSPVARKEVSPTDLFCFETIPDSPAVAVVEPYRPVVVDISSDEEGEEDEVTTDDRLLVAQVSAKEWEKECRTRLAEWSKRLWSCRRDPKWPSAARAMLELEVDKARGDLTDAVQKCVEAELHAEHSAERCPDYDEMAERSAAREYPIFTFGQKVADAKEALRKKIIFKRVLTPGQFKNRK